jgi:hypothetical protein
VPLPGAASGLSAAAVTALTSVTPDGIDPLHAAAVIFGGASATAAALRQAAGLLEPPPAAPGPSERRALIVRYGLAIDRVRSALGNKSTLLTIAPATLEDLAVVRELVTDALPTPASVAFLPTATALPPPPAGGSAGATSRRTLRGGEPLRPRAGVPIRRPSADSLGATQVGDIKPQRLELRRFDVRQRSTPHT